ncbi:porin [Psychrosphaera sp. 1_MG-2023]|uniref:porin n=1 Tax=Psychrosphaera sp. 1_MG-2023 TaxID=3062643 RepID=UPI0026E447FE|nr:porin [Psychrosphaera sp. 1_MG-2023]MDO6718879.1 porin [Psychrosphaera sp. 1_MG-2023]
MNNTVKFITATALAISSLSSQAEVRINGFASIVAGTSMDEDKSLYGYDDTLSFKPESLFALQVSSDLGDGLSATSQIIARGENDYDATFEWAYFSYAISDSTQLSVGRMRIPFYRYSDYLDVGYAYTWVRPPKSVYNLTFSTYDGASLLYTSTMGEWDSSLQLIVGSFEGSVNVLSDDDPAKLSNMYGINWTVGNYWLTARAVYMQADASISFVNDPDPTQQLNQFVGLLGAIGATDAANGLLIEEDDGSFLGIGVSIDYENFLIDSEFTRVEVEDTLIATQNQYYISFAYRFDEWTPYISFEHRKDENDDDYSAGLPTDLNLGGGPIDVRAAYQATLISQETENDVFSVGARYNFHPSAALKFDYTKRERQTSDASVLSVGLDLVF